MEKHIKIAYLVIAYMDSEQLKRLALRLTRTGDADVYIHINASVDITPFQKALADMPGPGRIVFSRERYRIVWAGYGILQASFSIMEQALQQDSYDRIVLLTGLDYPVKPDEQIQEFFYEHKDREFIHASVVSGEQHSHLYYYAARDHRFLQKCLQTYERLLRKMGKKGKHDYVMHEGQKYLLHGIAPKWAISGECASYLLDFYKKNKKFNRYFQMMHAPDDFYVATVLFHSRFRSRIESEKDIFRIIWLPEDKGAKILAEEDYPELAGCGQLYAKKFQSGYTEGLQRMLDQGEER